jgi:hypothetical protein
MGVGVGVGVGAGAGAGVGVTGAGGVTPDGGGGSGATPGGGGGSTPGGVGGVAGLGAIWPGGVFPIVVVSKVPGSQPAVAKTAVVRASAAHPRSRFLSRPIMTNCA